MPPRRLTMLSTPVRPWRPNFFAKPRPLLAPGWPQQREGLRQASRAAASPPGRNREQMTGPFQAAAGRL